MMRYGSTENLLGILFHWPYGICLFHYRKPSISGGADFQLPWNIHYFTSVMQLFCHKIQSAHPSLCILYLTIIVCSKHCFIQIPNPKVCEGSVNFGNHLAIVTNDIGFQSASYEYLNGWLLGNLSPVWNSLSKNPLPKLCV
jgi:hypothetical protein